MQPIAVFCTSSQPSRHRYATQLAQQLKLPLIDDRDTTTFSYLLVITDTHLALSQTTSKYAPIYVDFLSDAAEYRRLKGGGKQQLIARAVGIKGAYRPTIIDATAGLGEDGYVLACLGCPIQYVERSPIIAALLQDGLDRLQHAGTIHGVKRPPVSLSLIVTNAITYLTDLPETNHPDVIYLDPMFPTRTKTALVKKSMRMLRDVVGYDTDTAALLDIALKRATRRVVVKRPRLAPPIGGIPPNIMLNGKSGRFDVYLVLCGKQAP